MNRPARLVLRLCVLLGLQDRQHTIVGQHIKLPEFKDRAAEIFSDSVLVIKLKIPGMVWAVLGIRGRASQSKTRAIGALQRY